MSYHTPEEEGLLQAIYGWKYNIPSCCVEEYCVDIERGAHPFRLRGGLPNPATGGYYVPCTRCLTWKNDGDLKMSDTPARTYCSYEHFTDPMLRAVAASPVRDSDALRWLGYADQELRRLRERLGLPVSPSYALGHPQYENAR